MKRPFAYRPLFVCGLSVLGGAQTVYCGGTRLPDQDAFATGRGEAFVATADNPSAVFYNPAGITQLEGGNVRLGLYAIDLAPSYKHPATGATYNNEATFHAVPQLFYTQTLKDTPVSLGLGLYSPFGLGTKWSQDSGLLRMAGTEGSMQYYTINPVVAVKLPWHISLAAGLMVNYSSLDLQQGLSPTANNDLFRFKGDAWALGYNLGAKWDPCKKLSFGVNYRSATEMDYSGHTETEYNGLLPDTTSPTTVNYAFPLEVSSGVSFRPTEKWNLEFDAEYTDWETLGNLNFHQATVNPALGESNIQVPFNWESSWYYEFGVTRYFEDGWHVSVGYIFNENSVPNSTYTPLVADMDKHFFSAGAGYKGKHLSWDIAYQFGYGPDRTVTGSATPAGYPATVHAADGVYSYISHAVILSVGWHF